VEALPNLLYRVELKNGHRLLAHIAGRQRAKMTPLAPGDRVTVEMSPFDLSKGRIAIKEQ
jgi:translation initiation factor IF-1